MSGEELATAVQYGAGVVTVLFNNNMYGTIRIHEENRLDGRVNGTELVNPDFTALARAYGAHAESVRRTDEFAPAFERALASGASPPDRAASRSRSDPYPLFAVGPARPAGSARLTSRFQPPAEGGETRAEGRPASVPTRPEQRMMTMKTVIASLFATTCSLRRSHPAAADCTLRVTTCGRQLPEDLRVGGRGLREGAQLQDQMGGRS